MLMTASEGGPVTVYISDKELESQRAQGRSHSSSPGSLTQHLLNHYSVFLPSNTSSFFK